MVYVIKRLNFLYYFKYHNNKKISPFQDIFNQYIILTYDIWNFSEIEYSYGIQNLK
jgi:hypothetical protein